jgi:predicted enzyme related to lactoylglutathione lyase
MQHGAIWWNELMARDVPAALDYYRKTCGWSFDPMEMAEGGVYQVAVAHGRPVAGIADMTGMPGLEEVPPHWFTYIAVDDVDDAVSATAAAGGRIRRHPFEVPGIGRIAIVTDPTGAAVGLMTPPPAPDESGGEEPDLDNVPV